MEMKLRVFSPIGTILESAVDQVDFEALDGFFTLLPRHVDMISVLKPSILSYRIGNKRSYMACNKGVLVKKRESVSITTPLAILSTNLTELKEKIKTDFKAMEEERKEVNLSMAKLEIGLTKGVLSLKETGGAYGNLG